MPGKARYEALGPYALLKKLESDALGDLFRAVRIENGTPVATVALRRFAGDRDGFAAESSVAADIAESLTGPTFVKNQRIELVDGVVALSHEYASGRSLRYIVNRAKGNGSRPHPLPLDQALAIAERVALSLSATAELRIGTDRLTHGGLIPHFVWISDDGEIRVAGQGLGRALILSLRDERVAAEIARYFAPERQHAGQSTRTTEVYSIGALLYLLVTGHEPPDATRASAFTHAVRAAKTMSGEPVPDDIRTILEKSLNIDPSARFTSPADMHTALTNLAGSGRYAATSFNLAFYLSTLLKKEMEVEAGERERESKIEIAPEVPVQAPVVRRGKTVPIAIAATAALAIAGAAAWFVLAPKAKQTTPAAGHVASAASNPLVLKPRPAVAPEPIVATVESDPSPAPEVSEVPAAQPVVDEAAQKKLFEEAVKRRLQEELLKLQAEYTRQLRQEQARNAPVLSMRQPEPSSPREEVPQQEELTTTVAARTVTAATQLASLQPVATPPTDTFAPAPVPSTATVAPPQLPPVAAPQVKEGDVVEMTELDQLPTPIREPRPAYPPIAARQKIEATIMASILISEDGEVIDVKILRGEPRFGFNDSASRAFRGARYSPPMKDGKRVKTWMAQMIQFKP